MTAAIHYTERWHFDANGKADELRLVILVPFRTVSESNAREHWATKAARAKKTRHLFSLATSAVLCDLRKSLENPGIVTVRLDRIAPRALDDDNLRGCLKNVRDGVTDALGLSDDSDKRLRFEYGQERGDPHEYAVRVTAWRVT